MSFKQLLYKDVLQTTANNIGNDIKQGYPSNNDKRDIRQTPDIRHTSDIRRASLAQLSSFARSQKAKQQKIKLTAGQFSNVNRFR